MILVNFGKEQFAVDVEFVAGKSLSVCVFISWSGSSYRSRTLHSPSQPVKVPWQNFGYGPVYGTNKSVIGILRVRLQDKFRNQCSFHDDAHR